jgi:hypothetical protein
MPHEIQSLKAEHALSFARAIGALTLGHQLKFVADLAISGQIVGMLPSPSQALGGASLSAAVFELVLAEQEPSGLEGDLPANSFMRHGAWCAERKPAMRRGGYCGEIIGL